MIRNLTPWLESRKRFLPLIVVFFVVAMLILLADMDRLAPVLGIVGRAPYGDKIGHLCLFGLLAATLNSALQYRKLGVIQGMLQWGSAVVMLFAISEELSQLGFSSRTFDLRDMLANIVGIVLANWWANRRMRSAD